MTPLLGTLWTTHLTRTPCRPPHSGLRRELHGAGVGRGGEGERPGERRAEAGGGAAHAELLSQLHACQTSSDQLLGPETVRWLREL